MYIHWKVYKLLDMSSLRTIFLFLILPFEIWIYSIKPFSLALWLKQRFDPVQITEYASYVPPPQRRTSSSYKESVVPQALDHLSSVVQNTINSPVVVQSTTAATPQLNSGEQSSGGRYSVIQSQQSQIVDISGIQSLARPNFNVLWMPKRFLGSFSW